MPSALRLIRRCALCLGLFAALPAYASKFGDVARYLFVTHPASSRITVIDTRDDRVAGTLDAGVAPLQLEGSGDLAKLVAIDGQTPRVQLIELTSGRLQIIALDFVPQRIVLSSNGLRVAAFAPERGLFVVVDLLFAASIGPTRQHAGLHDLLFDRRGEILHIADDKGIERFDVRAGRPLGRIDASGAVTRLTPSATGRHLFADSADGSIGVVELEPSADGGGRIGFPAGSGVTRAYTNATGTRLFLPDSRQRKMSFVSPRTLQTQATLPAASGLGHVYSAWFDTITFVPSTEGPAVLVYDQERVVRGADIALPGTVGRGTVTPDGAKLYLPIADDRSLAVIDAKVRRLTKRIRLEAPPRAALMAVTFGICH